MAKAAAATAAKTGTNLVNVKAELAKEAAEITGRIQTGGGQWIRVTQDKKFVLPDGTTSAGPMSVVILDFVSANDWHDRPFKKGEESPPACFARGLDPEALKPSAKSPVKQGAPETGACKGCEKNEWGSAPNGGNGKACANLRLLAVTEPSADGEAKVYMLKVSPTGIKAFDAYVKTIKAQFDTVPIGVVTDIYFDPNLSYGSLRFGNPKPNANLELHFSKKAAAREQLLSDPDVSGYKPPVVGKAAKGKK